MKEVRREHVETIQKTKKKQTPWGCRTSHWRSRQDKERIRKKRKGQERRRCSQQSGGAGDWRSGRTHTNFALSLAASKKSKRRDHPRHSGTRRRCRSYALGGVGGRERGVVSTWHSKRRRSPIKGGATSRRGTPREAWGNSYIAANSPRRTAAWRGAAWKTLIAKDSFSNLPESGGKVIR